MLAIVKRSCNGKLFRGSADTAGGRADDTLLTMQAWTWETMTLQGKKFYNGVTHRCGAPRRAFRKAPRSDGLVDRRRREESARLAIR